MELWCSFRCRNSRVERDDRITIEDEEGKHKHGKLSKTMEDGHAPCRKHIGVIYDANGGECSCYKAVETRRCKAEGQGLGGFAEKRPEPEPEPVQRKYKMKNNLPFQSLREYHPK